VSYNDNEATKNKFQQHLAEFLMPWLTTQTKVWVMKFKTGSNLQRSYCATVRSNGTSIMYWYTLTPLSCYFGMLNHLHPEKELVPACYRTCDRRSLARITQ